MNPIAVMNALRKDPRPGRLFAAVCLKRTGLCRLFLIRHRDFVLRFHPTALSTAMFVNPDCRREEHDFFRTYLREGDVVIDVGANVGTLTLTASACVGVGGRVLAFEPHPKTFRILRENIRLNRRTNIQSFNVALGARAALGRLSNQPVGDDQNAVVENGGGIPVAFRDLDGCVGTETDVALLKIDVEGYELPALFGAEATLKRTRCIYFESSESYFRRYGYGCRDMFQFLRERGFELFRASGGALIPVAAGYVSQDHEDLIATKDVQELTRRTGLAPAAETAAR